MLLTFLGKYIQRWRFRMGVLVILMTFSGAMFAYVTPEKEGMGIAFVFLSSMFLGMRSTCLLYKTQFGADQSELGITGGLAGVARYAGGGAAVTLFETILITVQSAWANTHLVTAAEAAGATTTTAKAVLAALPLGVAAL